MQKTFTVALTEQEALDVRMALNATSIHWGEKAQAYRDAGELVHAATCERIRAGYSALWTRVEAAQRTALDDAAPSHAYFCDAGKAPPA
jgi:hypothetical protein